MIEGGGNVFGGQRVGYREIGVGRGGGEDREESFLLVAGDREVDGKKCRRMFSYCFHTCLFCVM